MIYAVVVTPSYYVARPKDLPGSKTMSTHVLSSITDDSRRSRSPRRRSITCAMRARASAAAAAAASRRQVNGPRW